MAYDVEAIRNQVKAKVKKGRDPKEFKPPKADADKPQNFRFYILPPYVEGDALEGGKVEADHSSEPFFLQDGAHYIDNQYVGCPRVINGDECKICSYAFDLMHEVDEDDDANDEQKKQRKSGIARRLLPPQYFKTNIYFPDGKLGSCNPQELRGQNMFYNAPQTVFNMWYDCLNRDDDGGDALEPLPFGAFFDERNAYLFQLHVNKDGQMNSYKKSKFIMTDKLKAHPIAFEVKGGKPVAIDERIEEILANRIDLVSKLFTVDMDKVAQICENLSGRSDNDEDGGFDRDETKEPKAKAKSKAGGKKALANKQKGNNSAKKGIKPPVTESSDSKDDLLDGLDSTDDISGEFPVDDKSAEAVTVPADDIDDSAVDDLLNDLRDDDD